MPVREALRNEMAVTGVELDGVSEFQLKIPVGMTLSRARIEDSNLFGSDQAPSDISYQISHQGGGGHRSVFREVSIDEIVFFTRSLLVLPSEGFRCEGRGGVRLLPPVGRKIRVFAP